MALWVCENCTTLYAVELYGGCPHCGHPDFHEFGTRPEDEEHPMSPKITRHGGAGDQDASAEAPKGEGPRAGTDAVPAALSPDDRSGRPAVNDPKGVWADYAGTLGLDVDGYTKAQVIAAVDAHETGPVQVDEAADEADEIGESESADDDE